MNRESNSPKLAVLDEIERVAGAKIDPALKYSLRFTTVSHLHLIRLRDFVDDAVKRATREAASTTETGYTRAQLADAVDAAHSHLHAWTVAMQSDDAPAAAAHVEQAHEALHAVGAGLPRVGCATHDPEAQAIARDLRAMGEREIPCGHKVEDLIYGAADTTGLPPVTKCGQCLADRQAAKAKASEATS